MKQQPFICLMYHNVVPPGVTFPELNRSIMRYFTLKEQFEIQMKAISTQASCVKLEELFSANQPPVNNRLTSLENKIDPATSKKRVHLTFDDGWLGTWEYAAPLMEKYNIEATVFITTNLIDKPGFICSRHLKNIPASIQIGSHAHTHTMLDELSLVGVKEEIVTSKKILEDLTGREINTFAFPGGSFVKDHITLLEELGFKLIFNSMIGVNQRLDPKFIKRIPIYNWTLDTTFQRYLRHQILPEYVRQQALSIPKKFLTKKHYLKIREFFLGEIHE